MKKETRREIQRLMALLLGLSLCIASMTYGYAGDTEDLGKTIEDGQTSKGAGQEAVDEAKEKLQEGMESLRIGDRGGPPPSPERRHRMFCRQ